MPSPVLTRSLVTWAGGAATALIVVVALWPYWPMIIHRLGEIELKAPDWEMWAAVSWIVQAHVYAALSALAIGTIILIRPKGRGLHKALGWAWVAAMAITAVSSLFIMDLNAGFFSLVHLFSGWVIIALPFAIAAIRNRRVAEHRRAMTSMFVGGLLVAGALTFIPGRIMFEMFFG